MVYIDAIFYFTAFKFSCCSEEMDRSNAEEGYSHHLDTAVEVNVSPNEGAESTDDEYEAAASVYGTPERTRGHPLGNHEVLDLQRQLDGMSRVMGDMVRVMQSLTEQHEARAAAPRENTINNNNAQVLPERVRQFSELDVIGDGGREIFTSDHGRRMHHQYVDRRDSHLVDAGSAREESAGQQPTLDDRRAPDVNRTPRRYQGNSSYPSWTNDRRNQGEGGCRRPAYPSVKMAMFSGKEEWHTWIAQFQAIAKRYRWTEDEKLDQLLPRLEGTAADFVFAQLHPSILDSYEELVSELDNRFRVIETSRSFASKFSRRTQKPEESIEDYAAELKRLYDKAHGYRDRRSRDEDLVRRFLDGLRDEDIRFEVEFHKEPRDIDEAVYYAVSLIQIRGSRNSDRRGRYQARRTYDEADIPEEGPKQQERREPPGSKPAFKKNSFKGRKYQTQHDQQKDSSVSGNAENSLIQSLLSRLEKLEKKQADGRSRSIQDVECFNCHRRGHYARDCPEKRQNSHNQQQTSESLNGSGPTLAAKERSQ